jgi:hypothetical protein
MATSLKPGVEKFPTLFPTPKMILMVFSGKSRKKINRENHRNQRVLGWLGK